MKLNTTIAITKDTKVLLDLLVVPKYVSSYEDRILWIMERGINGGCIELLEKEQTV